MGFIMCFPYQVYGCLCISYALLLVMIFQIITAHPLGFTHTYLAGFEGQTRWHLCFLHCFTLYCLIHMGAHFCINMVATAHLFWNN